MASSEVTIETDLISDSWILRKNSMKYFFYVSLSFLTLGIVYILDKSLGLFKTYYYDTVTDINIATHLAITFWNGEVKVVPLLNDIFKANPT